MLGLNSKDFRLLLVVCVMALAAPILLNPFPVDSSMAQFNAGYPALMQSFAIFGILAIGFNILFGLTGYLSFGHAAFLGAGSYAAVWAYKLLNFNVVFSIPSAILVAGLMSIIIGYISLRRSGIYFSILTLAFAQMSYALAYSVLTPITNGETGLRVNEGIDPQILRSEGGFGVPHFMGWNLNDVQTISVGAWEFTFEAGYYLCAIFLILSFYVSIRIFRSPFGMMLRAIKSNQHRLNYTGLNPKPYMLAAFVISGLYAGLAGGLWAAMDAETGAERMFWTASGEIVLMSILGGVGTLIGPILGAGAIKYMEKIISALNEQILHAWFAFMPEWLENIFVSILYPFIGKGWHLTLGIVFMLVVIFLPGGLVEGGQKIGGLFRRKKTDDASSGASATPAE